MYEMQLEKQQLQEKEKREKLELERKLVQEAVAKAMEERF